MRAQRTVLTILLAAVALQILYYYPQLPETVASHFGAAGRPNGWSSKEVFFGIYLGVLAVLLISFVGLPVFLRRISPEWINIPNRDYWLAPERRTSSITVLSEEMFSFGNATIGLMVCVIQLAIQANLSESSHLSNSLMWSLLAAYFVYAILWTIRLYRKFPKPR